MAPRRTLVIVLAGGAGGRLELLTRSRAKPAVPFGGVYRLIDFPLSNCLHSGVSDVWVIEQYNPVSLTDHLANGRPWDLDRTTGGLLVLHPRLGEGAEGWHRGTADALWRNAALIGEAAPEALVVLSADAVYKLDYAAVVEQHAASGADVTMVTTRVDADDASRYGVVEVSDDGAVTHYANKPDQPRSNLITTEVFVFTPLALLDVLEQAASTAGDEGLRDLGDTVLPQLVERGGAVEYRFDEYWQDVGTIGSYWSAHMALLRSPSPVQLDDPNWPIHTAGQRRGPGYVADGAKLESVLLAAGARISGTVSTSVLGPGVVVEEGATVRRSVILNDVVIERGAVVDAVIVDADARISSGATIGGAGEVRSADDLVLIGEGETVPAGAHLAPGTRVPEEDDD